MTATVSPRLLRFEPVNEGKPGPGSPDPYLGLDPALRPDTDPHEGPMTSAEKEEWIRCRNTVERGVKVWREVGEALATINKKRLYREKYTTFAECLLYEFGVSKSEAYRLMAAIQVVENVQEAVPGAKAKEGRGKQTGRATSATPAASTTSVHSPTPAQAPLHSAPHRAELWISKEAAEALSPYEKDFQKRIAKRLETSGIMEPTRADIEQAASWELLEDVKQARQSGGSMTISTKDQRTVVKRDDARLVAAARKRAVKERIEKDTKKLIRMVEKLSKHVRKMEGSGDFPQLAGMTVKALAVENEVKVKMAVVGTGKKTTAGKGKKKHRSRK